MSGAVVAAAAFNLACLGSGTMADGGRPAMTFPYEIVLRIDLNDGRFCSGDCIATSRLARVSGTAIVFQDLTRPEVHGRVVEHVDRRTGAYSLYDSSRGHSFSATAVCERRPFSGFPDHKS